MKKMRRKPKMDMKSSHGMAYKAKASVKKKAKKMGGKGYDREKFIRDAEDALGPSEF